jgi:hypothetical protein
MIFEIENRQIYEKTLHFCYCRSLKTGDFALKTIAFGNPAIFMGYCP